MVLTELRNSRWIPSYLEFYIQSIKNGLDYCLLRVSKTRWRQEGFGLKRKRKPLMLSIGNYKLTWLWLLLPDGP